MNIYRGCTHGYIYCDSRSTRYGMTHPFEDVMVKENAPGLLEETLRSKRKKMMIFPDNQRLMAIFRKICHENDIMYNKEEIFDYLAKYEGKAEIQQLTLF